MIGRPDAAAHDQGARARAPDRPHRIGAVPQERQRHGDQLGPQHPHEREHALDGVGGLQPDDRIGVQIQLAQPSGDGRDHAVGLRIG